MRPSFVRRSGLVAGLLIVGLLAGLFGNQGAARAVGSVIYVVPGGAGAQDGLSWATAKDLHAALTAAGAGAQLWVQAGTYTPKSGVEHMATFALKSGVAIYGGFVGSETELSQRNAVANVTTLSGELGALDAYHVVTGSGTDATALLDGVTISGGNADGSAPHNAGGGMYNVNGHPTLTNVTISGNRASLGGGLYNNASSPALTNVTISGNTASGGGGGLRNFAGSNPVLTNVTISGNTAGLQGGGLYNNASSPALTNVTISGNRAGDYGGGLYNRASSPMLINLTVSGNRGDGGGMVSAEHSDPVLRNSIVWGNSLDQILLDHADSTTVVEYSDVQDGAPGTGNLDVDPLFVTPVSADAAPTTAGDLRLRAGSPVINTGSNSFVPAGVTTDRDGKQRIIGGTVDMGAYERKPTPTTTTLRSSPNPSVSGQNVTFTARVTSSSGAPGGTVTFRDGATVLGRRTLSDGRATLTLNTLSVGRHTITARYNGNASYAPGVSPVLLQRVVRN